jgi:hypothetical protein
LTLEVAGKYRYNSRKVIIRKTGGQNMNNKECVYLITVVVLFGLAGCGNEAQIADSEPICLSTADKSRIMEIAEEALMRMNFVIEKYDTETGFIKTRPLRGGQILEFWRRDNASAAAAVEANLHSIRRTVQLNISESGHQLCTKCDVWIQRLSMPEKEIVGAALLAGTFTGSSKRRRSGRMRQSLRLNPEQKAEMAWIDLGSDAALERKILTLIDKKFKELEGPR